MRIQVMASKNDKGEAEFVIAADEEAMSLLSMSVTFTVVQPAEPAITLPLIMIALVKKKQLAELYLALNGSKADLDNKPELRQRMVDQLSYLTRDL